MKGRTLIAVIGDEVRAFSLPLCPRQSLVHTRRRNPYQSAVRRFPALVFIIFLGGRSRASVDRRRGRVDTWGFVPGDIRTR